MKNCLLLFITVVISTSCKKDNVLKPELEYKSSLKELKKLDEKGLATKEVYTHTLKKLYSLAAKTEVEDLLHKNIIKSIDSLRAITDVPGFKGTTEGKTWKGTYSFNDIESHFNKYDMSHIKLKEYVKFNMNEPAKFEHISSRPLLDDNHYLVTMSYFNDTVVKYIIAKCDIKTGKVLEIVDSEDNF